MKQQQRLGQFIYNKLRPKTSGDLIKDQAQIAEALWNLSSEDVIKLINEWRGIITL